MTASDTPGVRIGDQERDLAIDSLGEHLRAGRLTPTEYSDRTLQVSQARYVGDLTPVFADLPGAAPVRPASSDLGTVSLAKGSASSRLEARRPMDARRRKMILSLMPFVALGLFFLVGALGGWAWSWIFFLIVPVAGIVLHEDNGADGAGRADRRAGRRRR